MTPRTKDLRRSRLKNSRLFDRWGTFRKGMDARSIAVSLASHLEYSLTRDQYTATMHDLYQALALSARDRIVERWVRTQQMHYDQDAKRVFYLSAEYLMGRLLMDNLLNLGIADAARKALRDNGLDLEELAGEEVDAGLGNGGLGRLAACFLDSLATLEIPAVGYGIRYEFGIFDQAIRGNQQVEQPDEWLAQGNPWETVRPERSCMVHFYGHTEEHERGNGIHVRWLDTQNVLGIPYDTPVVGYANDTVNTLRLWAARSSREFDLQYFQDGNYMKAVEQKNLSENISKVLYPSDSLREGRELRLKQEYFFVSCSIQDIVRRYRVTHETFDAFPDKVAIQMNDTHPALAVPELMRVLLDEQQLEWEQAWDITVRSCAYTNHTLMAEAMEKWPVALFGHLLPRHLQIVFEINRRFLRQVVIHDLGDTHRLERVSLVQESPEKTIRMAHLAIVGSHAVNGVAELHTRLLKEGPLKDFQEIFPGKIHNKTNGITPRRWLLRSNPDLAELVSSRVGRGWVTRLDELRGLEAAADDAGFQARFREVKARNKQRMAKVIAGICGVTVDPSSIFDVQVKRIHEYKRQLLNLLHVAALWIELKQGRADAVPRTFILGGKSAPSYTMAKKIIQLACHVAETINRDPGTRDHLRVAFLPNYRVTLAEMLIPAADVSEQISTAGYEASGTGNMKFALNGALTVGTLDGANVEIREEVGEDNIFIFGLTAEEVKELLPRYQPRSVVDADPLLKQVVELIHEGFFSPDQRDLFHPITNMLLERDPYLCLADFAAYRECQRRVTELYRNPDAWTRKAILNVARIGKFSSDRTIAEYNRDVWKATPLHVTRLDAPPATEG